MRGIQKSLQDLLATIEYRTLSSHERAVKLASVPGATVKLRAEACGMTEAAVRRADNAFENGRPLGQNGRPNHFNTELMDTFIEKVRTERDKGKSVTYAVAEQLV